MGEKFVIGGYLKFRSLPIYEVIYANLLIHFADVDECAGEKAVCGRDSQCVNLAGSFKCRCFEGFRLDESSQSCVSVSQCQGDDHCVGNAVCGPQGRCFCPPPNTGPNCEGKVVHHMKLH